MRAKFDVTNNGVTLSYDLDGVRVERFFTCPPDGGYVREFTGQHWTQPCEALATRGSTLLCNSREHLPALIRSEYRAMIRNQNLYL